MSPGELLKGGVLGSQREGEKVCGEGKRVGEECRQREDVERGVPGGKTMGVEEERMVEG